VTGNLDADDLEPVPPERSTRRRWLWPVLGAATLAAFFAAAAGLSVSAAGPGQGLGASAGPTRSRPSANPSGAHGSLAVEACRATPGDGGIMTCPGRSPYLPPGVTPERYAAVKVRSEQILRALAAIDFCGPTDPVPCPSDTGPPPACTPSPCPRRTSPHGVRRVVPGDVAVIQAALRRAGFPDAEVKMIDESRGLPPMIWYAVPAPPLCVTGRMYTTDPPAGNFLSGIGATCLPA
jgi:hypothetical protein